MPIEKYKIRYFQQLENFGIIYKLIKLKGWKLMSKAHDGVWHHLEVFWSMILMLTRFFTPTSVRYFHFINTRGRGLFFYKAYIF